MVKHCKIIETEFRRDPKNLWDQCQSSQKICWCISLSSLFRFDFRSAFGRLYDSIFHEKSWQKLEIVWILNDIFKIKCDQILMIWTWFWRHFEFFSTLAAAFFCFWSFHSRSKETVSPSFKVRKPWELMADLNRQIFDQILKKCTKLLWFDFAWF